MDKVDNPKLNLDTSGLRNRLNHSSKDDKENHSSDDYEFNEPSLVSTNSDSENCLNESVNLIDFSDELNTESERKKLATTNGEHKRNPKINASAKFGGKDNKFRFNFQMPNLIEKKDKVDENKENFLTETVYTPSKRLQAENPDTTKNKKARLDESNYQPNWTIFKAAFTITLLIAFIKIIMLFWRNGSF